MSQDDIFDQKREERETYHTAKFDDDVPFPLTKDGFEAMLEVVCEPNQLPVTDSLRLVLAGYVHHCPNDNDKTTLKTIEKVVRKSVSNNTTWRIDQEIKQQRILEAQAAAKKAKEEQDNVLSMPPRPAPGENAQV